MSEGDCERILAAYVSQRGYTDELENRINKLIDAVDEHKWQMGGKEAAAADIALYKVADSIRKGEK